MLVVISSPALDLPACSADWSPNATIGIFDAAGNLLSTCPNALLRDYVVTDPEPPYDGAQAVRHYQFQAYTPRGYPTTAWQRAGSLTADPMALVSDPPLRFYAHRTAVDSRGRVFAINGGFYPMDGGKSSTRCTDPVARFPSPPDAPDSARERVDIAQFTDKLVATDWWVGNGTAGDWCRVYRRDGDHIVDFPQLHHAMIHDIAIDAADNVFVGGVCHYQDNAYLRRYDNDGNLDWSVIAPPGDWNPLTDAVYYERVKRVIADGSGGCYFAGINDRSGISFVAHVDATGSLTWKWSITDDRSQGMLLYDLAIGASGEVYTLMAHYFPSGHTYQRSNVQRRDPATGAILAHGLIDQANFMTLTPGWLSLYDGSVHAFFDVTSGDDYFRLDASTLTTQASAAIGLVSGDPWGFGMLEGRAATVGGNGVIYTGSYSSVSDGFATHRLIDDVNTWEGKGLIPDGRPGRRASVTLVDDSPIPPKALPLKPARFSWIGDTYTNAGALAFPLRMPQPVLRREYVGALRLPDIYRLLIEPDAWLEISSVSIQRNVDGTRLTVISPEATASRIASARARKAAGANAVLYRGVRFTGGREQLEPMLRGPIQTLRSDRGGRSGSLTITVDAAAPDVVDPQTRQARGVSYIYRSGPTRRVRCAVDTFLRPGDTLALPDGDTFVVSALTYTISPIQGVMEVTE